MTQVGIDIHAEALFHRGAGAFFRSGLITAIGPGMTTLALPANRLSLLAPSGAGTHQAGQLLLEVCPGLGEQHPILWPPRSGYARLNRRKIKLRGLRVFRFRRIGSMEPSLFLGIGFDQLDLLGASPSQLQIAQCLRVDGEDAAGGAIFW